MRTVYHGGIEEISSPLVNVGRTNLDFGRGFYVTDLRSQAKTWAGIKSRYLFDAPKVINQYSFDFERAIKEFRYKKFEHYDSEWLNFIVASRSGKKLWHDYDIIEGGVANDRVIDTIEAYMADLMTEERALGELSKHQPNNQICILKQSVIDKYLQFEKSEILK
ncbi:MAG: DUF3990 domain-containing protein [Bacteroidaceae bacterium]|nr:DUF3990 domain-containing protein [Bacteroidaceae bacterium]